jgi:hypothetical protein
MPPELDAGASKFFLSQRNKGLTNQEKYVKIGAVTIL